MQILLAKRKLVEDLIPLYGQSESTQISNMVIEQITGWTRSDLLIHGREKFTIAQQEAFHQYSEQLLAWRPVQYVLGEAWFAGMRFAVDERVLIPRPETEELVDWIRAEMRGHLSTTSLQDFRILDIGTGSGCIPIALKKYWPDAEVWSVDKSNGALALASQNALELHAHIHFLELDILDEQATITLPQFDLMVSNPPYVPVKDMDAMRPNVLNHEPHMALFVPDDDALLFYRTIAMLGMEKLKPLGKLFFEIHAEAGQDLVNLLTHLGYRHIELKCDLSGLHRMVQANKPA